MKKSKSQLAAVLNLSRQKVTKHLNKATAPHPDAAGLYDVSEVRHFIEGEQRNSKGYATGDLLKAKVEKLQLECRELRQKMHLSEPAIPLTKLRDILWDFLNEINREMMAAANSAAWECLNQKEPGPVLKILKLHVMAGEHRLAEWCRQHALPIRGAKPEPWPVVGHPSFAWGKLSKDKTETIAGES